MLVGGLLLSVSKSSRTLLDPMDCNMAGFPVLHYLPELAQTHVHWVGDAIQPSHPLSLPSSPAFNLSQHQGLVPVSWLFTSRRPKYWSFSFSVSPFKEYLGLNSFRIDWFDLPCCFWKPLLNTIIFVSQFKHVCKFKLRPSSSCDQALSAHLPLHLVNFIIKIINVIQLKIYMV